MKAVIITGSPHKKGTSALLADEFIRGLQDSGHETYRFDAAFSNVKGCLGCNHCRKTGEPCVHHDDMEKLVPYLLEADAVIFVTPIYYFGMSSQLKTVIKDILEVVKNNSFIFILCIVMLVYSVIANMGVMVYYFKYIVQNTDLMGTMSLVTIITIPLPFVFPKLISKLSVAKLMMAGFLLSALGYLVNFFAGSNFVGLMIGYLFTGAGTVPVSMLMPLAIIECADFNEWKGIRRMEGTLSSLNGLAQKIGNAAGAGVLGILLELSGYTGELATTSQASITMIRMLYSLIPMIAYIIVAVLLYFYKLDKLMPQIKKENQERRALEETVSDNQA